MITTKAVEAICTLLSIRSGVQAACHQHGNSATPFVVWVRRLQHGADNGVLDNGGAAEAIAVLDELAVAAARDDFAVRSGSPDDAIAALDRMPSPDQCIPYEQVHGMIREARAAGDVLCIESGSPVADAHALATCKTTAPPDRAVSLNRESPAILRALNTSPAINPSAPQRLTINQAADVAILDGDPHAITPDAARIIQRLLEARGRWVSGEDMKSTPGSAERPDRIIKRMPDAIRSIIQSEAGKGSRVTIFD